MAAAHPDALVIGSEEWVESFPDGLYDLAMELTLQSVEQVERLDPINRKLIWDDGKARIFRLHDHVARMQRSAKSLHLP
ncbi:MAG: hypothetical protein P8Y07_11045, partial [Gemmatimonadales bacterium]